MNPTIGPKTYPEQIIRKVQGCTLGIAAKGTLSTADIVPNIETSAISLELRAKVSNSKKKATIARVVNTAAISPQLRRAFRGHEGNRGRTKAAMPMNRRSARQM